MWELQFQVWHARFSALADVVGKTEEQREHDTWNPMVQESMAHLPDIVVDGDPESRTLIRRLFDLALLDRSASNREKHLEELALRATLDRSLAGFDREVLLKRASLIAEDVAHGALPPVLNHQATLTIAMLDLGDAQARKAAMDRIEGISEELQRLDDKTVQLPRTLVAATEAS